MKFKMNLSLFLLIVITLVAFVIRIYNVSKIPPGFFADEASIGYNAYTLLTKGEDEKGNKFPILFQNFDTFYRPGISVYLSAPFVLIFGLNEFSLRLASATFGTLSIIVLYGLARAIFPSKKIALFSSFFLTVSPWHIHFSRINQEFIYLVFFLSLSIFLFLVAVKKRKKKFLITSFVSFGFTLYTYVPAYFLVLLFIFLLVILYWKDLIYLRRFLFIGLGVFCLMAIPLVVGLKDGKTLSRYYQISSTMSGKTELEIARQMVLTYRDHFMPAFLFDKGDIGYPSHFITRFSVRGMGELYWFQLPLILVGIIYSFRYKKSFFLILGWLLLYPLGSTLAPFADGGGPFATRSIIGVIPFQILSAMGLIYFLSFFKRYYVKSILFLLFLIIMLFSFKDYAYKYFVQYNGYSSDFWGWQYGPGEIIAYFKEQKGKYDDLYLASKFNAPEIFIKFYDPENICSGKCRIGDLDKFDSRRKQLFAIAADSLPSAKLFGSVRNIDIKKTIFYPNGYPAFYIAVIKK